MQGDATEAMLVKKEPNDVDSEDGKSNKGKRLHKVLRSYIVGQCANVTKAAVWWAAFSPLLFAIFPDDSTVIGANRLAYNIAIFLISPIAGKLLLLRCFFLI